MLGQRILTALVLLALLLPALWAEVAWPFQLLTLVLVAGAGWEWGRLNQGSQAASLTLGAVVALGCAAMALLGGLAMPAGGWLAVLALWLIGGAAALRAGPAAWQRAAPAARWLLGPLVLGAAWLAIVQGRAIGINFVLSTMALVWAADIAAYLFGHLFGRHKLAPTISPGKTWEGALGGLLGVFLLAWGWMQADAAFGFDGPSLYTRLQAGFGSIGLLAWLVLLTGLSVAGDLFESLVKRAAGAKDSSRLLPGHGGVLDRIDALLPVCPAALAALALAGR